MKYLFFIAMLCFAACNNGPAEQHAPMVISHAGKDASCPYFTHTSQGIPAISWIETDSLSETGVMYYAIYDSVKQQFTTPIEIPTSAGVIPHDENLPKVLFMADSIVIAVYGVEANDPRNKYAGKVMYTQSFDGGKSWQPSKQLVQDTAGYDQRYFDVALLKNGNGAIVWLDNRKETTAEGSSLYFAEATGHEGFGEEHRVASKICQCCRTKLYIGENGEIHAVYRAILNDSIRDMVHQVSTDGGQLFSDPVRISADNWVVRGCPHTGPTLAGNSYGLHFAWFTMGNGQGAFYCQSVDNGKTYTNKEKLSDAPMAKHPQIANVDDNLLLVWDEPVPFKNEFNNRIGFQVRKADGELLSKGLLTDSSTYASYPVISNLGAKAFIAYKQLRREKGNVVVSTMKIE